jgi:hypothetical protein
MDEKGMLWMKQLFLWMKQLILWMRTSLFRVMDQKVILWMKRPYLWKKKNTSRVFIRNQRGPQALHSAGQ